MKTMKTTAQILLAVGIAASTAFVSCDSGNSSGKTDYEFSLVSGKAAFRLDASSLDYNRDEDLIMFDSASVILPEKIYGKDLSELRDSIIKAAFDTIAAPVDAMNSYFVGVASEIGYPVVQLPSSEATFAVGDGIAIVTGSMFNLNADRLTYLVTNDFLAPGGANGMSATRFFTYDIAHGKIVSLTDIFTPEGLDRLPELIKGRALHLQAALGPTDITALPADGNFYISLTNEIVFVYQPFEVASHAQGEISVPFEGYQLQNLMTPYGMQLLNLR